MADRIETAVPAATAPSARRGLTAAIGAIVAGFLASLCCVGPLAFVIFGVGAGFASSFEPLRPVFTALTLGLLALGFYTVYRRPVPATAAPGTNAAAAGAAADCAPDGTCVVPRNRTRDKVLLWVATVVALVFLTFPQWSLLLV